MVAKRLREASDVVCANGIEIVPWGAEEAEEREGVDDDEEEEEDDDDEEAVRYFQRFKTELSDNAIMW